MSGIKTITVQRCKLGYGLTDGKKWFFYAYHSQEAAQSVLNKVEWDDTAIRVNICYREPLKTVC